MSFTLVFDGDLKQFDGNPFKTETPFGKPHAVCLGDALEIGDELLAVLKEAERVFDDIVEDGYLNTYRRQVWADMRRVIDKAERANS